MKANYPRNMQAAAFDLYVACKDHVDKLESVQTPNLSSYRQMRAAIAKADGWAGKTLERGTMGSRLASSRGRTIMTRRQAQTALNRQRPSLARSRFLPREAESRREQANPAQSGVTRVRSRQMLISLGQQAPGTLPISRF